MTALEKNIVFISRVFLFS